MIDDPNVRVQLPGGSVVLADRQPASTGKLERAGLLGETNAHTFFLSGSLDLDLRATLTVVAERRRRVWTELPEAQRLHYEIRDVDAWDDDFDDHTEVLTLERVAPGTPDPAFKTETWTRIREIKTGQTRPSGLEETDEVRLPVELSFVGERGDAIGDRTLQNAEVVAEKGTLQDNDKLVHPTRGFYEVRNVVTDGDYERGILLG